MDDGIRSGVGECSENGVVGGRFAASEREVGAERGWDELGEWAEISDLTAECADVVVIEGTAVEQDGTGNGLIESEEECEECAFAGAGGAGDEELRAWFEHEVDAVQHGVAGMICEGELF